MNGLVVLLILAMGAVGGWSAYALVYGGTRKPYPEQIQRKMDRWDGTR